MTSRREAVSQQREKRLEVLRTRIKGMHFDIHAATQTQLQRVLLDHLLDADSLKTRNFCMKSTDIHGCFTAEDALVYRNFFARCVHGIWHVTLAYSEGDIKFEFARL